MRSIGLVLLLPLAAQAQSTPRDYLQRFDTDGNGRIGAREYVDYLAAGFRTLDSNGDGVLDTRELPSGPRRAPRTLAAFEADVRAQFRRLDRNRDGYLSAQELAQPPR